MTKKRVLLVNIFVVAACALVYEFLIGTLASYLLGDAVVQFSVVLGTYLSAMGVGAWASRFFEPKASDRYVEAELVLSVIGGTSVPALLHAFGAHAPIRPLIYGAVFAIGLVVGVELPLLLRILRDDEAFKDKIARALALDYIGALGASLLFPLVLMPQLGLVRTSLLIGMINALVALSATFVLELTRPRILRTAGLSIVSFLAYAFISSPRWAPALTD